MKSMSNMQKVATLSIVFIRTTSWRRRAGMKRTSFSTRSSRKVRSTDRPPSDWPMISQTLQQHQKKKNYKQQYGTVKALSRLVSYRISHHLSSKGIVYFPTTSLLLKNTFTSQLCRYTCSCTTYILYSWFLDSLIPLLSVALHNTACLLLACITTVSHKPSHKMWITILYQANIQRDLYLLGWVGLIRPQTGLCSGPLFLLTSLNQRDGPTEAKSTILVYTCCVSLDFSAPNYWSRGEQHC